MKSSSSMSLERDFRAEEEVMMPVIRRIMCKLTLVGRRLLEMGEAFGERRFDFFVFLVFFVGRWDG